MAKILPEKNIDNTNLLYMGNSQPSSVYYGDNEIYKIYFGSTLVYEKSAPTSILEAGTYKWIDEPSNPALNINTNINFTCVNESLGFTKIEVEHQSVDNRKVVINYTNSNGDTTYATDNKTGWNDYPNRQTITLETNQEVTQEFYTYAIANGNLVKVEEPSTGETWVLNSSLTFGVKSWSYNINFTSNGNSYSNFSYNFTSPIASYLVYGTTNVYDANNTLWISEAYRTITFSTAPAGDLLTWLQANGVKQ